MAKSNQAVQNPSQKQSRQEVLSDLSSSELKKRYLNTFQVEPDASLTDEAIIAAINEAAPKENAPEIAPDELVREGKNFYGNKDSGKKHPFTDETWKDKVVVRQVNIQQVNGGMIETPNTETLQTYDPPYFDQLVDTNFFSDSKMKVEVLHRPSKK